MLLEFGDPDTLEVCVPRQISLMSDISSVVFENHLMTTLTTKNQNNQHEARELWKQFRWITLIVT